MTRMLAVLAWAALCGCSALSDELIEQRKSAAEQGLRSPDSLSATWKRYLTPEKKGEFETTEEFSARRERLPKTDFYFVCSAPHTVNSKYDADRGEAVFTLRATTMGSEFEGMKGLAVESETTLEPRVGKNAFGVKRAYRHRFGDEYVLHMPDLGSFASRSGARVRYREFSDLLVLSVPLPREAARRHMSGVQVMLGVSIDQDANGTTYSDFRAPTIRYPLHNDVDQHVVEAVLHSVIVFDPTSKELIHVFVGG